MTSLTLTSRSHSSRSAASAASRRSSSAAVLADRARRRARPSSGGAPARADPSRGRSRLLLQCFGQAPPGGVEAGHHGPDGNPQQLRDLAIPAAPRTPSARAPPARDRPAARSPPGPGAGPRPARRPAPGCSAGASAAACSASQSGASSSRLRRVAAVPDEVEAEPAQDLVQPGVERQVRVDTLPRAEGPDERLLGQVHRVLGRADQAQRARNRRGACSARPVRRRPRTHRACARRIRSRSLTGVRSAKAISTGTLRRAVRPARHGWSTRRVARILFARCRLESSGLRPGSLAPS